MNKWWLAASALFTCTFALGVLWLGSYDGVLGLNWDGATEALAFSRNGNLHLQIFDRSRRRGHTAPSTIHVLRDPPGLSGSSIDWLYEGEREHRTVLGIEFSAGTEVSSIYTANPVVMPTTSFATSSPTSSWSAIPLTGTTWRAIDVPHAIPTALASVCASAFATGGYLSTRRARVRTMTRRCPKCGYDVRATPRRCPECGMVLRWAVAASSTSENACAEQPIP